jgi:hypothetical protein
MTNDGFVAVPTSTTTMAFLWTSLAPSQEFSPVVLVVSVERVSEIALPDELVGMKALLVSFPYRGYLQLLVLALYGSIPQAAV